MDREVPVFQAGHEVSDFAGEREDFSDRLQYIFMPVLEKWCLLQKFHFSGIDGEFEQSARWFIPDHQRKSSVSRIRIIRKVIKTAQ